MIKEYIVQHREHASLKSFEELVASPQHDFIAVNSPRYDHA